MPADTGATRCSTFTVSHRIDLRGAASGNVARRRGNQAQQKVDAIHYQLALTVENYFEELEAKVGN